MKRLWPKINKITFVFLSFFLVILFLTVFSNTKTTLSVIVVIIGLLILIEGLIEEKKKLKHERFTLAREVEVLIILPVAATLTFLISTRIDLGYGLLGPVVAAGFIGFIGSFLKGCKLANPVYCGAFVGMSSAAAFPNFWWVSLAGLIAGFVFILSHEIYNQTGGTLGTIAFSGVSITKKMIMALIGGPS
ncbi:MAG: hypothetical protein Q8O03_08025 [Nanoarchaeota archaeon]|nr:hypothetical protein [Nanoarchaeota archaeon]